MTWVRKDDQMPINRKVASLSDGAYRLDDEAICWSSRNLTDGVVVADDFGGISKRATVRNAGELVRRGRWHRAGDEPCTSENCPPPGEDGWVIHDYLEYNPSAAEVRDGRKKRAERQRNWRSGRRTTSTSTDEQRDASRDGPVDPLVAGAPRARVVPARPGPSLPNPLSSTSPLAALGLDEREIKKTEEAILLAMPNIRSMPATIRSLIANGDISIYVDQARAYIVEDAPKGQIDAHAWDPDKYGAACTRCPLPKDHPSHLKAA